MGMCNGRKDAALEAAVHATSLAPTNAKVSPPSQGMLYLSTQRKPLSSSSHVLVTSQGDRIHVLVLASC